MPELRNPRHERFCAFYILLGNASEAYRQAGYRPQNADVKAPRLLVSVGIQSRIAEIKAQTARKSKLSLEGAVEFLSEIVMTPPGEITKHSRLCESFKDTCDESSIKMPSKIAAVQELGRILAWHAPDRLELSAGSPLTKYLSDLRSEREVKAIEIEAETEKGVSK